MATFSLKYQEKTPEGKRNFIGITHRYFDEINKNNLPKTNDTYIQRYEENIFPYVDISTPAEDYDEETIEDLISRIRVRSGYSDQSINSSIRHLIYDPCMCFFQDPKNIGVDPNTLWGSANDYRIKETEDRSAAFLKIRKSLSIEEEKVAAKYLLDPKTEIGENPGLTLMFLLGTRNNETCPLRFGDIREMTEFPGCYYVQIFETVRLGDNTLKASGKTANSPRRLPIMPVLLDYLRGRKEYICSQIRFPYTDSSGKTFSSVDELPIACRGNQFSVICRSKDLTLAGKRFLHDVLKLQEQEVSGIAAYMIETQNTWEDLQEKDVTTYLFRRNFATHLYNLGLSLTDSQYYMGHAMDNTPMRRADYANEEYLHYLYTLLLRHPLNHPKNDFSLSTRADIDGGPVRVRITNKEYNDQILIQTRVPMNLVIRQSPARNKPKEEVDITDSVNQVYWRK